MNLNGTRIDGRGLVYIAELPKLKHLWLGNTDVSDEALEHIGRMLKLERLLLDRTKVTDAGLKHLERLHGLQLVQLSGTRVTQQGVSQLRKKMLPATSINYTAGFRAEPAPTRMPLPPLKREIDVDEDGKTDRVEFFGHQVKDSDLADLSKPGYVKELSFWAPRTSRMKGSVSAPSHRA